MPVLPESTRAQRRKVEFGGIERRYHLFVPPSYDGNEAVPLVCLLHGGGGLGSQMFRFTGFDAAAKKHGFIVVCPDGVDRHWNDGRLGLTYRAHRDNVDDVRFMDFLLDALSAEFNIDRSRQYIAGFSNGGMMAFRLGLELPEKIAAIATVAANLPEVLQQKECRIPMPVLIMKGTDDPIVSWSGGELLLSNLKLGHVLSVPQTVQFWTEQNGCEQKPLEKTIQLGEQETNLTVIRADYMNDSTNAEVIFYTINGAGHVWPGQHPTAQYLPENRIGKACLGFDATETIWEFFQIYSREPDGSCKRKAL